MKCHMSLPTLLQRGGVTGRSQRISEPIESPP
jgi:hypothetical protein